MQYTHLGRSGLVVSRMCLGTMNFGPRTSEKDAFAIMDKALELGINFFDTANAYGSKDFEGETEQIVGRWLVQGGERRDRIALATKVYLPTSYEPNDRGLSAYHIRKACEDSLRRLRTDHIDLYQMHHIDRGEPTANDKQYWNLPDRDYHWPPHLRQETLWEETWQAMELLVQQGKVIYVGSSNFAGWHISQANEKAAARNFLGLVSEQCLYNLKDRMVELEVLPACREYGLGVIPWSPLSGGLLAGTPQGEAKGRRSRLGEEFQANQSKLDAYGDLCKELGEEEAGVALAWLLQNPVVTGPIIGPRTVEQLFDSLRALEIRLDESTLVRLDEIWPGPGGEAPEAFAW
jgi:aryl-alcohol dehydrogenase-like predicted oxidoreductase